MEVGEGMVVAVASSRSKVTFAGGGPVDCATCAHDEPSLVRSFTWPTARSLWPPSPLPSERCSREARGKHGLPEGEGMADKWRSLSRNLNRRGRRGVRDGCESLLQLSCEGEKSDEAKGLLL
jgi:hypothetical protein